MRINNLYQFLLLLALGLVLSGCLAADLPKHERPLSYTTVKELEERGFSQSSPILIRIFKKEAKLEVWKQGNSGAFSFFKTYDICNWSGDLGPKLKQGDRQAPEGFYTIRPHQMNPWSKYYLSFNLGYPNKYDASFGRTGNFLMVHGGCRSAGCYAMTDENIAEIYALAREAFNGGQAEFQVQAFPFKMDDETLASHSGHKWFDFWQNLKIGYDAFEQSRSPLKIDVCSRKYIINASFDVESKHIDSKAPCPPFSTFPELESSTVSASVVEQISAESVGSTTLNAFQNSTNNHPQ